jgi:hypothetical protein
MDCVAAAGDLVVAILVAVVAVAIPFRTKKNGMVANCTVTA